jgi:hypothetical protein
MSTRSLELIRDIDTLIKNVKEMSEEQNEKVYEIYSDVYNRAISLNQNDIIDSFTYRLYRSNFKHDYQTPFTLDCLKKGFGLATSNNYFQIRTEMEKLSSFIKSMSDYYDETKISFNVSNM